MKGHPSVCSLVAYETIRQQVIGKPTYRSVFTVIAGYKHVQMVLDHNQIMLRYCVAKPRHLWPFTDGKLVWEAISRLTDILASPSESPVWVKQCFEFRVLIHLVSCVSSVMTGLCIMHELGPLSGARLTIIVPRRSGQVSCVSFEFLPNTLVAQSFHLLHLFRVLWIYQIKILRILRVGISISS